MITFRDIESLLENWRTRLNIPEDNSGYDFALQECIKDLQELLDRKLHDEMSFMDCINPEELIVPDEIIQQEAEEYLTNEEHYHAA